MLRPEDMFPEAYGPFCEGQGLGVQCHITEEPADNVQQ